MVECRRCEYLQEGVFPGSLICTKYDIQLALNRIDRTRDCEANQRSSPLIVAGKVLWTPPGWDGPVEIPEQSNEVPLIACDICGAGFATAEGYREHMAQVHWFTCEFCGAIYKNKRALGQHKVRCDKGRKTREKQEVSSMKCQECGLEFENWKQHLDHVNEHHSTCRYCGKKCRGLKGRNRHEATCKENPDNKPVPISDDQLERAAQVESKEAVARLILWRSAQKHGGSCKNCAHQGLCVYKDKTAALDWVLCKHWVPADLTEVAS